MYCCARLCNLWVSSRFISLFPAFNNTIRAIFSSSQYTIVFLDSYFLSYFSAYLTSRDPFSSVNIGSSVPRLIVSVHLCRFRFQLLLGYPWLTTTNMQSNTLAFVKGSFIPPLQLCPLSKNLYWRTFFHSAQVLPRIALRTLPPPLKLGTSLHNVFNATLPTKTLPCHTHCLLFLPTAMPKRFRLLRMQWAGSWSSSMQYSMVTERVNTTLDGSE